MYLGANLSPRELFFFQAKGPNIIRDWHLHDGVSQDTKTVAHYVSSYYTPYEIIGN